MILIDSLYINKGGGKVLLEYFISKLYLDGKIDNYVFIIDSRFKSDELHKIRTCKIFKIDPTEKNRKRLYRQLLKKSNISSILCLNNIPPPFSLTNQKVFIYFHNTLLLSSSDSKYSFYNQFIFFLKRVYLKIKLRPNYHMIVQSKLIKKMVEHKLGHKYHKILVLPFFNDKVMSGFIPKRQTFLYVADGVPQKNIDYLLIVWEKLGEIFHIFPELILTINENEFPKLVTKINKLISKGIKITNLGVCNYNDLVKVYDYSEYLVFPSLNESFGLPLIEAGLMKCKIISAALPYVNQIIEPSITFNPFKPDELVSIIQRIVNNKIVLSDSKVIVKNSINQIIQLIE
jgi:glycosyltransferase involved in cell wall biosynthesis